MLDCINCDFIFFSYLIWYLFIVYDFSFNELLNVSKNMSIMEGEFKGWCLICLVFFGCIIVIIVVKVDLFEGCVNSVFLSCGWFFL